MHKVSSITHLIIIVPIHDHKVHITSSMCNKRHSLPPLGLELLCPPLGLSVDVFVAGGTDYISTFLKQPTNKQRKNTRGEVNVEVSYTI